MNGELERAAELLRRRNALDADLAEIMGRPMTSGHLGEWIAGEIFDIELEESAVTPRFDGHFRAGPLHGRTVNIKWYRKRENLLDTVAVDDLDYYLVLTGPAAAPESSRGRTRPWVIAAVYLFDAQQTRNEQLTRGIKTGTASSVLAAAWQQAEIFPRPTNPVLPLTDEHSRLLRLFAHDEGAT